MKITGSLILTLILFIGLPFPGLNRGIEVPSPPEPAQIDMPDEPLQVVQKYCDLAISGNYAEIAHYTVDYPREYFIAQDKSLNLYRQSKGETIPQPTAAEKPKSNKIKSTNLVLGFREIKYADESEYESIMNDIPPKLINRDQTYISGVENVWINDRESRVRVIMKSRINERYRAQTDFLLYKTKSGWKIFLDDELPYFPVYGIPENERPKPVETKSN